MNALKQTLLRLSDAGVRFVVGGGVAAVLHGVERVTLDLDLAVDFAPENMARFLDVMRALGLQPRAPVAPEFLLDPSAVRAAVLEKKAIVFSFGQPDDPLCSVDVFLREDLAYAILAEDAVPVALEGRNIAVVSKARLLAMKQAIQPPRPKDQMDIQELKRLLAHA